MYVCVLGGLGQKMNNLSTLCVCQLQEPPLLMCCDATCNTESMKALGTSIPT